MNIDIGATLGRMREMRVARRGHSTHSANVDTSISVQGGGKRPKPPGQERRAAPTARERHIADLNQKQRDHGRR